MVYLVIKELSKIAEDVIMVTSSIMKDMQPNLEVIYRPNAIRALARIIDVGHTTFMSVEELISRPNQSNLWNDTLNPPLSTDPHPSLPHPSSPRTTSTTSLPPSLSVGQTKPRRPSTPKPFHPLHSLAHLLTSREEVRGDTKQSLRQVISCNTTLLGCCI